mmetsp:Transcript_152742/g.266778  ORF Transcript_152742/g.266778 Transcript_152742/m.266778 type:complete len:351 (-) Transcript_152742:321-1373(-)
MLETTRQVVIEAGVKAALPTAGFRSVSGGFAAATGCGSGEGVALPLGCRGSQSRRLARLAHDMAALSVGSTSGSLTGTRGSEPSADPATDSGPLGSSSCCCPGTTCTGSCSWAITTGACGICPVVYSSACCSSSSCNCINQEHSSCKLDLSSTSSAEICARSNFCSASNIVLLSCCRPILLHSCIHHLICVFISSRSSASRNRWCSRKYSSISKTACTLFSKGGVSLGLACATWPTSTSAHCGCSLIDLISCCRSEGDTLLALFRCAVLRASISLNSLPSFRSLGMSRTGPDLPDLGDPCPLLALVFFLGRTFGTSSMEINCRSRSSRFVNFARTVSSSIEQAWRHSLSS